MTKSTTAPAGAHYKVPMHSYLTKQNANLFLKQDVIITSYTSWFNSIASKHYRAPTMRSLSFANGLSSTSDNNNINISGPSLALKQDVITTSTPAGSIPLLQTIAGVPTMKSLSFTNGLSATPDNDNTNISGPTITSSTQNILTIPLPPGNVWAFLGTNYSCKGWASNTDRTYSHTWL